MTMCPLLKTKHGVSVHSWILLEDQLSTPENYWKTTWPFLKTAEGLLVTSWRLLEDYMSIPGERWRTNFPLLKTAGGLFGHSWRLQEDYESTHGQCRMTTCQLQETAGACRILRSVLLSAAVIVVQPVLIIEVGTHWRQVKGEKSYLTLSGGDRSHGQTVHLWMSLC